MSYTITDDCTACGTNLDEVSYEDWCEIYKIYYELYTIEGEETY